jgi:hypothetical protein
MHESVDNKAQPTRGKNMNAKMQGAILVLIIAGWFAIPAYAQKKEPIEMSSEGMKSSYIQQHAIDVDDVSGHQIRVQETHREFAADRQTVIRGERIIESWVRGFSSYTAGVGPAWGYGTWITDKGNKIFIEYTGNSESSKTETGSRRGTYHGTSRLVGGTGPFATIRGNIVDSTKFDTDSKNGYNVTDSRGEYWFQE